MSIDGMAHQQDETVTIALPHALVEQLAKYDPEATSLH